MSPKPEKCAWSLAKRVTRGSLCFVLTLWTASGSTIAGATPSIRFSWPSTSSYSTSGKTFSLKYSTPVVAPIAASGSTSAPRTETSSSVCPSAAIAEVRIV
jgi:hypothetical protein